MKDHQQPSVLIKEIRRNLKFMKRIRRQTHRFNETVRIIGFADVPRSHIRADSVRLCRVKFRSDVDRPIKQQSFSYTEIEHPCPQISVRDDQRASIESGTYS